MYRPENPMIVQGDKTVLLEVANERYKDARDALARFAELVKSPEHIHTYKITPLSLWNASASGSVVDDVITTLYEYSKYDIPGNIVDDVKDFMGRYGKLRLIKRDDELILASDDPLLITEVWHYKRIRSSFVRKINDREIAVFPYQRGHIKQGLINLGFPVQDLAGYARGTPLALSLDTSDGELRYYQEEAVDIFYASGSVTGGSGVIVLPCGAGKTLIGIAALEKCQCETLILVTNITALKQWKEELLKRTTLSPEMIGEYSGEKKEIKPVTIITYQILTYRRSKKEDFVHFDIFNKQKWGLVVYDEVHLLPAPVFRVTAEIQSMRRLGLTATLVREDGREEDVFSLIGPKKYDVPWKVLEKQGWIATAECTEVRVSMPDNIRIEYAVSGKRAKFRIASENPEKIKILNYILRKHEDDSVLVIGQYISQLEKIASSFNAPLITGSVPNGERSCMFKEFKEGQIKLLIVSKVANFAVDLPEANVAIQVSGTFGSRQEEAQRLGRILRLKKNGDNNSHFYSLVTRDSLDQEFAANRQLFLTEQGYRYNIRDAEDFKEDVA